MILKWIEFVPIAYKGYSGIESDMFAYAMAAGYLGLKHTLLQDFMSTCMRSDDPNIHPFTNNYFIHYCSSYHV